MPSDNEISNAYRSDKPTMEIVLGLIIITGIFVVIPFGLYRLIAQAIKNQREVRSIKKQPVTSGVPTTDTITLTVYQITSFDKTADTTPCTLTVANGIAHVTRDNTTLLHSSIADLTVGLANTAVPMVEVSDGTATLRLAPAPRKEINQATANIWHTPPELIARRATEANIIRLALCGQIPDIPDTL